MEYVITHKVDSHRVNPNYKCLVIDLLKEPWFHYEIKMVNGKPVLTKANIIPTYEWMLDANHQMCRWKPDYAETLRVAVMMGDFDER